MSLIQPNYIALPGLPRQLHGTMEDPKYNEIGLLNFIWLSVVVMCHLLCTL